MKSTFRLAALACGVSSLFSAADADAAGLYFSDRGVRPMGRAGAFVAGADDLGAIWYNPAGLADAGTSVLVDFAWLRFSVEYQRELLVTDASNTLQRFQSPTVNGNSPVLPIPTIAASYNFGAHKEWTIAGGVFAPQVALASYASTVDGQPSPARYTLGSFSGSLLAIPGIWAAYKPVEEIRLGLGLLAMVGTFQSTITFGANPQDRLLGAPEQPEFDANAQLKVGPIVAPTINGGATWVPAKIVRFGISGQLPMVVSAPATIKMQMPSAAIFDGASQGGQDAHVRFELPGIFRMGVEVRPTNDLRIEATFVREFWTTHHSIDVMPVNLSILNVQGLPPVTKVPPLGLERGFDNSNSFRLGAEYTYDVGGYRLDLRGGLSYETTAVPKEYLSLSALDFDKVTLAIGGGLHVGKHWRFDGVYAHLFASSVYVDPAIAKIPRVNPIKGNAPFEPVNGGRYSANADLIGVGLNYKF